MADGIQYEVQAILKVVQGSQFHAEMGKAAEGATKLQSSLEKVTGGAQQFATGLSDVVGKATHLVGGMAAMATAATTAATAFAVKHIGTNLALLESKAIQLSSVVAAATERPFAQVQVESRKLFEQFRNDAIKSAGETQDFVEVAALIAGPVLGAGQSMAKLRELTQGVMNTAPALAVSFKQAGSDVMRILQGTARIGLPLFRAMKAIPTLGIPEAKEFNKLDVHKRLELVTKALTNPAFKAGAEQAAESWAGLSSTAVDLMKNMGGMVLGPSFEALKRGLSKVNAELIEGLSEGGPLRVSLTRLGDVIGTRFVRLGQQLGRIFPNLTVSIWDTTDAITNMVANGLDRGLFALERMIDRWPQISSQAERFAGWVSHAADRAVELVRALGGGDLGKGLERAALLYGGSKIAAPVSSMALGTAQMGMGLAGMAKWAGIGGAGSAAATAAAAAEGAAAGAAAGAGGAGGAAAGAAGAAGSAGLLAGGGLLAGVAGFAASTYLAIEQDTFGFFQFLRQQWDQLKTSGESLVRNGRGLWRQLEELGAAAVKVYEALKPVLGVFASLYAIPLAVAFEGIVGAAQTTIDVLNYLAKTLQLIAQHATPAANKLAELIDQAVDRLGLKKPKLAGVGEEERREIDISGTMYGARMGVTMALAEQHWDTYNKPAPPPKDTKKIEVTVKFDLGESNEEALIVRTKRELARDLARSTSTVRVPRSFP
jgi:hypothetical protein